MPDPNENPNAPGANAAGTTTQPPTPPTPPEDKDKDKDKAKGPAKKKIKNPEYAGQKVGGLHGPIEFDEKGIAEVGADDATFFLQVPGYTEA